MRRIGPDEIDDAIEVLDTGGTVIYPTETCYGLGCDALDEEAVTKVYEAKERPREKKLTVIVSSLSMAERYCHLSDIERTVCERFMPGPLTLIARKNDTVPDILNDAFAFRVSSSNVAHRLSEGIDMPVVATSANLSGQPSSYSIDDIDDRVLDRVDLAIDAGTLKHQPSSTVIDLQGDDLTIHREGPVSKAMLTEAINGGRDTTV